jgi:hypothetical protein
MLQNDIRIRIRCYDMRWTSEFGRHTFSPVTRSCSLPLLPLGLPNFHGRLICQEVDSGA